ncbi:MAG: hypothetical protein ABW104_00360 [Candidatus Thiodiazotropha sp. 6PLUC2]
MPRAIDFYQNMLGVELKQEMMDGIEMAVFPYDDKNVSGCLVKPVLDQGMARRQ